jgi:DNA adenine methylase
MKQDIAHDPQTFLKWAGGKTQLLSQFEPLFPKKFNRFFEPFLGSGAVFFYLSKTRKPHSAFLSDGNQELIDCYLGVRDHLNEIVEQLGWYKTFHSTKQFYQVRKLDPWVLTLPNRAARFIYLNKTCFNGLYRVNKRGEFNVPIGRYKNPPILQESKLRAASLALAEINIKAMDFIELPKHVEAGDFVYFDPPYQPLSATSNFTGYTEVSFDEAKQYELAETCRSLSERGALIMLSNSATRLVRDLYPPHMFRVTQVEAKRSINSNGDSRGLIPELVITNYDLENHMV